MVSEAMQTWVKESIEEKPCLVDEAHVPTAGELNNIVYLTMKYLAGWQMRQCDLGVVLAMNTPKSLKELDEAFVPVLAEYVWDHLMGEPDEVTTEDLEYGIRHIAKAVYGMDDRSRNCCEAT
jgi:hypothetical protein